MLHVSMRLLSQLAWTRRVCIKEGEMILKQIKIVNKTYIVRSASKLKPSVVAGVPAEVS